ncbi:unnamed protein product [Miscanthus lutarioriparius]|uniref:RNA helicase n=1 Tax=Miscanthus lutarioriparius TaxID=422564 RepID=A0A811R8J8_9POAL|nr:unnamed protein product [Miscanthus lutarioriparius]
MGAEQQRLDDEMERRRIRVKDWQVKLRELQGATGPEVEAGGGAGAGKKWTLEGDESDEEEDGTDLGGSSVMDVDCNNGGNGTSGPTDVEEEEIDPLDAFMNTMVLPEVSRLESNAASVDGVPASNAVSKKGLKKATGRIMQGDGSDSDYDDDGDGGAGLEDEDYEEFMKRVKKTKVEKLAVVDHSKIDYQPFRKNFYIEAKDIREMTSEELERKVHGKDVPKPIKTWLQSGQTSKLLDTIKKLGFEKPMPIQAQALPVIMSGRDCIGVAKTGSGKTLAFLLPMLRHVKDQPPVAPGDGPVGLIVAPTRELVVQIHSDIKKFSKVLGISCVAIYGGSGVAQQISELKRGAEIVVCTTGRMIDILCTSNGKITNLRRVTFLVMDEADRMFDMGFEPQITRIIQNTRRDRQTVLFSATFPRQVEMLARKVLIKPVEIQHGYQCLSLHGGKDQADRESTVADFKSNICGLLIATSVAARGLDVKELELVVNYDVPIVLGEQAVLEEERYAPDLVKALELSEQTVPEDLKALADRFMAKFNEEEDEAQKSTKKAQAREYGYEEEKSDSDFDEEEEGGVAITIRGTYIAQGKVAGANERKLYLFIEGHSESCVKKAKAELKRVLEDCVNQLTMVSMPLWCRWPATSSIQIVHGCGAVQLFFVHSHYKAANVYLVSHGY